MVTDCELAGARLVGPLTVAVMLSAGTKAIEAATALLSGTPDEKPDGTETLLLLLLLLELTLVRRVVGPVGAASMLAAGTKAIDAATALLRGTPEEYPDGME